MTKSEVFPYVFGSLEISAIPIFGELVNQFVYMGFCRHALRCDPRKVMLYIYIHLANQLKLDRVLDSLAYF